ncbi:response regulator [Microbacterium sp.]|uniref:response regulator n=1 Tax=Microbacterium sp. TaxID=51671 RepID=UPI003A8B1037
MTIRLMLVDDQDLLRESLATVLGADPRIEVVAQADTTDAAVDQVRRHRVDIALMDVRMPGQDGIEGTRAVREASPDTRVLVLTTFDLDEYVVGAVRAGASGFFTKDVRPAELIAAIVAVSRGDAAVSPRATATLLRLVNRAAVPATEPMADLSPRERDVTRLLATGASNEDIGRRLFLTENTVKTHVRSVLSKLGLPDRVQVVIWAYENGVVSPGGHPRG